MKSNKNLIISLILLPVWYVIYTNLQTLSDWFIDTVLVITKGEKLTEALRFFIFEFPKVLMLLVLIIFFVEFFRSFFTAKVPEKALEGN